MLQKKVEKILPFVQKPARYVGGELNSVVKDKSKIDVRYAFCFPDTYEIGMSHLGMKILYGLVNSRSDAWCERVFAPDFDMEEQMRENDILLFALESGDSIKDFDLIGFTMQYELSYTNVLNMINLAGLPLRAKDRTNLFPILVCGGPCVCNAEPVADFFDVILPGEGEEVTNDLIDLIKECKKNGTNKTKFLELASQIQGVYVPSLYNVEYNADGTVKDIVPTENAPKAVKKRIISDLNSVYYPKDFVVPFVDIVHDRAVEEIFRGCIRGCRFCQAGFLYRPIREKSTETINKQCHDLCENTGYDEVSLCSLSTSDHSDVNNMLTSLIDWTVKDKINLSLPSLRVDNFTDELVEQLNKVRRSGLTFAPEAGTQRLRDVINKNISEDEVLRTCNKAFSNGWTGVKLYFMIGLPTETLEDVKGIADLAKKVVDAFYQNENRQKGKGVNVSISVASFIPKPFTPFMWEPEDTREMLKEKLDYLMTCIDSKKISVSWHDTATSLVEGVLARGDRRLSDVLEKAYLSGCKFDSWDNHFHFELWKKAFENCGLDPAFYANRKRDFDEIFPWEHMDYGISKKFFEKENLIAHKNATTPNCREKCNACGANMLNGGQCDAKR